MGEEWHSRLDLVTVAVDDECQLEELLGALQNQEEGERIAEVEGCGVQLRISNEFSRDLGHPFAHHQE